MTVAVTGPTGTFGFGLMPLLQTDDRIARVVGIARRPFDPAAYGWTKMEYRRGDGRDPGALQDAFGHADVVVHLAFSVPSTLIDLISLPDAAPVTENARCTTTSA